jgi:SWI/SNF-related matrix-associated actin-dependent regulator 1 of chromatin subfamily A
VSLKYGPIKKPMVLTDSLKQTGTVSTKWIIDVFIVNFKSLEKFFDFKTSNKGFTALYAIIMDPRIGLFKSAIIDEIHKLKNPKSLEQRSV